jgi:hypothetical protein
MLGPRGMSKEYDVGKAATELVNIPEEESTIGKLTLDLL